MTTTTLWQTIFASTSFLAVPALLAVWLTPARRGRIGGSRGGPGMSRRTGVAVAVGCLGLVLGVAGTPGSLAAPVPRHLMKPAPQYFHTQVGTKRVYLRGHGEETQVV